VWMIGCIDLEWEWTGGRRGAKMEMWGGMDSKFTGSGFTKAESKSGRYSPTQLGEHVRRQASAQAGGRARYEQTLSRREWNGNV